MIELCGLPGVGKSTLARMLEQHGYEKVRVNGKGDLLLTNIQYLLRYPTAFLKLFFAIVKVSLTHGRFYPLFMNVFLDTNARIFKAKHSSKLSIVDQGNLQGLLSLSYHPLTEKNVAVFLKHLPKPDLILILKTDEDTRMKRLKERGYGPREREKNREAWLLHLQKNMESLEEFLQTILWAPILSVSAEDDPQEILKKVLAILPSRI